jgi:Mannosylglycerate hydrolase MGH1-like glycoside hydrolase domain
VTAGHADLWRNHPRFSERAEWFLAHRPLLAHAVTYLETPGATGGRMLSMVSPEQLQRILARVLDPDQLLSDHGVRSLSRRHGGQPVSIQVGGETATVDYEPAESTNYLFGGNSNWRGPVWFPLNYLLIESLDRFGEYLGDGFTVEDPVGGGRRLTLHDVANELARRLISLFVPGPDGRRPVAGDVELYQTDPAWTDLLWFHEYFHGDTGAGLGASHQTGWTGLVLDLIADRRLGGRA